jgi:hypothetical protein
MEPCTCPAKQSTVQCGLGRELVQHAATNSLFAALHVASSSTASATLVHSLQHRGHFSFLPDPHAAAPPRCGYEMQQPCTPKVVVCVRWQMGSSGRPVKCGCKMRRPGFEPGHGPGPRLTAKTVSRVPACAAVHVLLLYGSCMAARLRPV